MKVEETYLKGCYVITPKVFKDTRGCFYEAFNVNTFEKLTGIESSFVQDNISKSSKGVLRGLHFQKGEAAQAKLVQVLKGSALDVCVDLRERSETFGKHFSLVLNEENHKQLYIPRGFAHGFLALEDNTIFSYKCDNFYNKESEVGLAYNDLHLNIDWGLAEHKIVLSVKDQNLLTFKNLFN